MRLEQELKASQLLDKRQFLALKMLSLNSMEMEEFLDSEILSNPLIEFEDPPGYSSYGAAADKLYELYEAGWDAGDIVRGLLEQIDLKTTDMRVIKLAAFLLSLMDEDGYIRYTLDELTELAGSDEKLARQALEIIHHMKPAGVGAYDLTECLLLQADAYQKDDEVLKELICCYLQELAGKKYTTICRSLGISREQLEEYRRIISSMNPRPLASLTKPGKEEYIIPDIIYSKNQKGQWTAALSEGITRRIHVSSEYQTFNLAYADPETRSYYYSNLNRIKLINYGLEKRENTLKKLAEYFLKIQIHYIETGRGLKPLSLKEAAKALGMHESTISRAVKDRYVQLPGKMIPMKQFLARRPKNKFSSQTPYSADQIKEMICGLVAGEDPENPLSDMELCRLLRESGIVVSRRTVTKYRCQKNINNSFERKQEKKHKQ